MTNIAIRALIAAGLLFALSACGSSDVTTTATSSPESESDHDDHGDEADHDDDDDDDDDDHDDHGDSSSGLGAHEHGSAELLVAWSDGEVVIDLVSPTFNIFGFEYEATADDDLAIVAESTEALSQSGLLAINADASCVLADDVVTKVEYEGSHAELTTSWLFTCVNTDDIAELDASAFFAKFPNVEDLDVQWASDSAQSSAELSPSSPILTFE